MTIGHPALLGSIVRVWFVDDEPVRLVIGEARLKVVGHPRTADINGAQYWRLRAHTDAGRIATVDLKRSDGDWVLAGVEEDAARTGAR
jgi:hypothetical protein